MRGGVGEGAMIDDGWNVVPDDPDVFGDEEDEEDGL